MTHPTIDEQVTGGVLTNLFNLFQGVMDWGDSPHDAASFEATVTRGGVVVEVQAADEREREVAERETAGGNLRTPWQSTP